MREKETHGKSSTPTYRVWAQMIQRCGNPKQVSYKNYGGKGVQVCLRWRESFAAFLADMGERPSANHSIERNDSAGSYEPENCRWATRSEQNRNTSRNRTVAIDGREILVTDLAESNGISAGTARMRLHLGWPAHLAATVPVKSCGTRARARLSVAHTTSF